MMDASAQRDPPPSHAPRPTARHALFQGLQDDRLLLGAFVVCVLLIGYQLSVTLLQPPWIKPATDWLRTALAWPQVLVVAWVAVRLLRAHYPRAVAWCWVALGLLSYAVARTTWTLADLAVSPHGVPFPSLPDLFFILQYPCFLTALFLVPVDGRWLPGLRILVDGLLWMSAVTALSWYFVLLPLSLQTSEPPLSKQISMGYQVFDLVLFYGLVGYLARPRRTTTDVLVTSLLSLAVGSLVVADTWAAILLLHPPHTYRTGSAPDLFWFICYLLVPLAAVVRLRVTPAELPSRPVVSAERLKSRDLLASIHFILPSVAVVGAGAVIIVAATVKSRSKAEMVVPEVVAIVLLLLATLRPAVMFLEQEELRRAHAASCARERALRLANERMEAFLSVLGHELKTPLTSLMGNVQLMARRLDAVLRLDGSREDYTRAATVLRTLVERCDHSLQRIRGLVEDVLDETRVRQGRLVLHLEPYDLAAVVGEAVEEQVALNPERHIRWVAEASPVPVIADASRIEQVVVNYVSNALKFSREDQAVEVRLQTVDGAARVSVHDEGIGVPLAAQPYIWERFYQAAGADVQSGSQIGMGIGLYISRKIIEEHHGRVGIESAPHQGTTVWFTLPLAASSPGAGGGGSASTPLPCEHETACDQ